MSIKPLFALVIALSAFSVAASAQQAAKWYRGNTHTHTLNSDGDSTPDEVAKWYRTNGYNFVFITDHEYQTNVEALNGLFGRGGQFLVIPGQEVTDGHDGKAYHSNALGTTKVIMPAKLGDAVRTLQKNIDEIVAAGGVAQVNHPNFLWSLTAEQLIKLNGYSLLEIHNGHPLVNNLGSIDAQGHEALWDAVLSSGKAVYGIADDDSHTFKPTTNPVVAAPGRGWIYVRATELTKAAILEGLRTGNFYASTGVEIEELTNGPTQVSIKIKPFSQSRFRTQFIGRDGKMLAETGANPAVYQIKGNEGYVRARIVESNGKMAWTQPFFVKAN